MKSQKQHGGFSIVEVLVSMGVLLILLSLVAPTVIASKRTSIELSCVRNSHEIGRLVLMYSGDYRDLPPATQSDRRDSIRTRRDALAYTNQTIRVLSEPIWLDSVGLARTSSILRCPSHTPQRDIGWSFPIDYKISSSLYVDPTYFNPFFAGPTDDLDLGTRLQTFSSVLFPDQKSGLHETEVWHGFPGVVDRQGSRIDGLEYHNSARPGSAWFVDGHAGLFRARDAVPGVKRSRFWGAGALSNTPWGIRGRDRRAGAT